MAFQDDRENWEKERDDARLKTNQASPTLTEDPTAQIEPLLQKIAELQQQQGLARIQKPDDDVIEQIAKKLDEDYESLNSNTENQTTQEKVNSFTDYCFNLIQSNVISAEEKGAILYLLKMRLSN